MAEPLYLDVFGHAELRNRLASAVGKQRLPQSLLFHGPRGVGKQRLAVWTAAALNCTGDSPPPCGRCRGCRLSGRLQHPDINWFFPLPRPKRASGPEQLKQKLEDARAAALEERRGNPLYVDEEEGATGIYLGAVHTMRRLATTSPAMGPAKVLVIGKAEAMVSQLGSPEAANALLKLLEEPPADTTIILTSDVPGALLPTIRSRVQSVRVTALAETQVAEFLTSHVDLPAAEAKQVAARSGGSIGRALELLGEDRGDFRDSAIDLVRALLDGRSVARLAAAHRFRAFGARGSFSRILTEARSILRDLLADRAGAAPLDPQVIADLRTQFEPDTTPIVQALRRLDRAQDMADRNVNPQLIVVNLLHPAGVV